MIFNDGKNYSQWSSENGGKSGVVPCDAKVHIFSLSTQTSNKNFTCMFRKLHRSPSLPVAVPYIPVGKTGEAFIYILTVFLK